MEKTSKEIKKMKIKGLVIFGLSSAVALIISLIINPIETLKWWPILFAIVNSTTLIIGLGTSTIEPFQRKKILDEVVVIAAIVLFLFAIFGKSGLDALGLGFPTFQIAGGILLALIAGALFMAEPGKLKVTHIIRDPSTLGMMMACPGSVVIAVLAGVSNLLIALLIIISVLCLTRFILYLLGVATLVAKARIELRLVIIIRLSAILIMTIAIQDILEGLGII